MVNSRRREGGAECINGHHHDHRRRNDNEDGDDERHQCCPPGFASYRPPFLLWSLRTTYNDETLCVSVEVNRRHVACPLTFPRSDHRIDDFSVIL